jgi:hypothetical protein
MSFPPGDVLLVPVVFSDGSGQKKRPVVVVYDGGDVQNAQSVFIKARFTPGEAEQIEAAAKQSGLTVTDYVRKNLLNSISMVTLH